jgi:hypothetical protein
VAELVDVFRLHCPLRVRANLTITNETFHVIFEYDRCPLALVASEAGTVSPGR